MSLLVSRRPGGRRGRLRHRQWFEFIRNNTLDFLSLKTILEDVRFHRRFRSTTLYELKLLFFLLIEWCDLTEVSFPASNITPVRTVHLFTSQKTLAFSHWSNQSPPTASNDPYPS